MNTTIVVIPHYGPDRLVHDLFRSIGFELEAGCFRGRVTMVDHPAHPFLVVNNNVRNLGFTASCNIGLRRLLDSPPSFRHAWVLCSDTVFDSGLQFERSLEVLLECSLEHRWAIAAQQVRRADLTDQIVFGGMLECFPEPLYKTGLRSRFDWAAAAEEEGLSFCSALIGREVPEKIGMMDESFVAYYSDSDYCLSAREAGYGIGYAGADSFVYHTSMPDADLDLERRKVKRQDYLRFWDKWIGGARHGSYLKLMGRTSGQRAFKAGELRERAGSYPELRSYLADLPGDLQIGMRDIAEHFWHRVPPSSLSILCNLARHISAETG